MKIPFVHTAPEEDLYYAILFAPLWWIIGITWFVFHIISCFVLLKTINLCRRNNSKFRINFVVIAFSLFIVNYAISILYNFNSSPLDRIIASLYNLSFWLMGVFIITSIINLNLIDNVHNFKKACLINLYFIFFVLILGIIVSQNQALQFPSLLKLLINIDALPPLISGSTTLRIFNVDFLGYGRTLRGVVMSPYPTAMAGSCMLLLVLTSYKLSINRIFIFNIFVSFSIVILSHSRIGIITFILILIILLTSKLILSVAKKEKIPLIFFLVFVLFFITITLFINDYFSLFINKMNSIRENSSSTRFSLYQYSVDLVLRENPLIGIAIKPRGTMSIPLGSHSTYVGILLKTGLIGLFFFILTQITIFIIGVKTFLGNKSDSICFQFNAIVCVVLFNFFLFFEDLDAPQFLSFLYFTLVGISCLDSKCRVLQNS